MEDELLKLASTNGVWAMLFVVLFLYTIMDSRGREKQYQEVIHENQNIIKELSEKFGVFEDIKKDVCDIKNTLDKF